MRSVPALTLFSKAMRRVPHSPSTWKKCAKLPSIALYLRNSQSCRHSLSTWGEMREVAVTHSLLEEKCAECRTRSLLEEKCAKMPSLALYPSRNARSCLHVLSTWEKFPKWPSLALYLRRNARSCRHSLSTWEEMRRAAAQMTLLKVQQHLGGALQVGLPQIGESSHGRTVQHPTTEDC
jgi:hypothetical protein